MIMAAPTNHFKLGLFVLLALGAALATVVFLGAQSMKKDTVKYHTYFNESVQGLDVGAPVKYRGVSIGTVSQIEIAPDHRHVDVVQELDVQDIRRMGLAESSLKVGGPKRILVPPDLRAQLGSQGITGVKFVSIDFFDPKTNPPPQLPFEVAANYIPAAPSMMKNLEDTISKAMDKLPELVDAVVAITSRVDRMVAQLEKDDVTGKASSTLAHADQVLTGLNGAIADLDRAKLPAKTAATLEDVQKAVAKMNGVLDRIDGDDGLVASVRRASDAFGSLGRGGAATTREIDQTLREVRETAESIRLLTEALERDPDMLLKGRAKARGTTTSKGVQK
jgi:phospholipid/cholesterol/gamma-HCH transport system substrate-binding protein